MSRTSGRSCTWCWRRPPAPGSPPVVVAAAERRVAQLLSGICEAAEAEGTTRLFARLPEGSATVECFRRWGFDKVLTEHTYVAHIQAHSTPPPRLDLRAQRPADAYPLWQLYRASTPAVVQTAEALSSRQWDLRLPLLPRWLLPHRRARGWVVPGADRPLAWVQLAMEGYRSAVAEMMVDPDASDLVEDLLGLRRCPSGWRQHAPHLHRPRASDGLAVRS